MAAKLLNAAAHVGHPGDDPAVRQAVERALAPLLKRLSKLEPEVNALKDEVKILRAENKGLTNALIRRKVIMAETAGAEIHRSLFEMTKKRHPGAYGLRLTAVLEDAGLYHYIAALVGPVDAFDRESRGRLIAVARGLRAVSRTVMEKTVAPPCFLYAFGRIDGGNEEEMPLVGVERYNPASRKWSRAEAFSEGRRDFAVGALAGSVFAVGGWSPFGALLRVHDTVDRYDPRTGEWTQAPPLLERRSACTLATYSGGLYAIGGRGTNDEPLRSVERYDHQEKRWVAKAPLKTGRERCTTLELDGDLYVIGGECNVPWFERRMERYNAHADKWEVAAHTSMKQGRSNFGTAVLRGQLYVLGGWGPNGRKVLRSAERFDPQRREWELLPEMPTARYGCAAVAYDGCVYVIGGEGANSTKLKSVERYDPLANQWTPVKPMHFERSRATDADMHAVVLDDGILVLGGQHDLRMLDKPRIERYNPRKNEWARLRSQLAFNPTLHLLPAPW